MRLQYCFIFIIILKSGSIFSQTDESLSMLVQDLNRKGYENIQSKLYNDDIILAYENRLFRFDYDALRDIINSVVHFCKNHKQVVIMPKNRGIPILAVTILIPQTNNLIGEDIKDMLSQNMEITIDVDLYWEQLKNEINYNKSYSKIDLTFKPTISADLGDYSKPVKWQLNLLPGFNTSFWKGMLTKFELIIPLHNDLRPIEDSLRTGLLVVNQVFRLPNAYFISTSAGYFNRYRYGFDFEIAKYLSNGNISIKANYGLTAFAAFVGRKIYYENSFNYIATLCGECRIPKYDLTLKLEAGKFLMGDNSVRFDIWREFKEVQIGFYAIKSTSGYSNGGFYFSVPIFPSKYSTPEIVRFRPGDEFSINYAFRNSLDNFIGMKYDTRNSLDMFMKKLNPDFIKNLVINSEK